jgi:hypothetical protein
MARRKPLSLEELAQLHQIVPQPVAAVDLETGMVLASGGRLTIVISVAYENSAAGPLVVVETVAGLERFPATAQVVAWHVKGKPFFVDAPEEYAGPFMVARGGSSSAPPAQDAAGIVPVWRGPKRPN